MPTIISSHNQNFAANAIRYNNGELIGYSDGSVGKMTLSGTNPSVITYEAGKYLVITHPQPTTQNGQIFDIIKYTTKTTVTYGNSNGSMVVSIQLE